MKKSELKSQRKAETKKIKKEIEISLVGALNTVTAKLGKGTDKLAKKIGKGSKKLAKKIANEIKPEKAAPVAEPAKTKPVAKAKTVTKAEKKEDAAKS